VVPSAEQARSSFAALFRKHHCPVPERLTFATSILSQLVLAMSAGMLMIAPKQALEFSPYKSRLIRIPVREEIDAPPIVIVRRTASPLTPAAEHFCDLMRRAI
jgi:DNA-binding transcriptional LysR family regulator